MIIGLTLGFVAGVYLMAFIAERRNKKQLESAYSQGRVDCGNEVMERMRRRVSAPTLAEPDNTEIISWPVPNNN